jgi:hypothetical protein
MGMNSQIGSIYMTDGDKTTLLGSGIPFTEEIEFSANENPTRLYHCNDTPSLSLEIRDVDLEKLNNFYDAYYPNRRFTMEADVNIMVQARWHKKTRIRKKWLKRFGMKLDTIKMKTDATVCSYNKEDGSIEFETDKVEYVFKPHHMRRGLKIEL